MALCYSASNSGYLIHNIDYGCCITMDPTTRVVSCTLQKEDCVKVKQSTGRFVTHKGCVTMNPARTEAKIEECIIESLGPNQQVTLMEYFVSVFIWFHSVII